MKHGVALLSGGLDSCVAVALTNQSPQYRVRVGLFVDYGQKNAVGEQPASLGVALELGIEWRRLVVSLPSVIGTLAPPLIRGSERDVPKDRSPEQQDTANYIPGRNTFLLALAQSVAEMMDLDFIVGGMSSRIGVPDCDNYPDFMASWNALARLATKKGRGGEPILVRTPLMDMTKEDVIRAGVAAGAPLGLTRTCFDSSSSACGSCDPCQQRLAAFAAIGLTDPATYEKKKS